MRQWEGRGEHRVLGGISRPPWGPSAAACRGLASVAPRPRPGAGRPRQAHGHPCRCSANAGSGRGGGWAVLNAVFTTAQVFGAPESSYRLNPQFLGHPLRRFQVYMAFARDAAKLASTLPPGSILLATEFEFARSLDSPIERRLQIYSQCPSSISLRLLSSPVVHPNLPLDVEFIAVDPTCRACTPEFVARLLTSTRFSILADNRTSHPASFVAPVSARITATSWVVRVIVHPSAWAQSRSVKLESLDLLAPRQSFSCIGLPVTARVSFVEPCHTYNGDRVYPGLPRRALGTFPACQKHLCCADGCTTLICTEHGLGDAHHEGAGIYSYDSRQCHECDACYCDKHERLMRICEVCTNAAQAEVSSGSANFAPDCRLCPAHKPVRCNRLVHESTGEPFIQRKRGRRHGGGPGRGDGDSEVPPGVVRCPFMCCASCLRDHTCLDDPTEYC